MVGATIAAVFIGVVMLFVNFPVGVIIWVIWAIAYQQIENYLIQPQIQKRAVQVEPFIVLVAVLFGSTLFGVLGAILAIPAAATLQIVWREWRDYRRETLPSRSTGAAADAARAGHLSPGPSALAWADGHRGEPAAVGIAEIEAAARTIARPRPRRRRCCRRARSPTAPAVPVAFKAENLQRTGSFKTRGALNKVAALSADELGRGLVAASAGNHAQAVAVAARSRERGRWW